MRHAGHSDDRDVPPRPPRLCFVGPLAGARPGTVVTQGVRLSAHFRSAGHEVTAVSESSSRYVRFLDTVWTLIRRSRDIDILVVHVYGGLSFLVEDAASLLGRLFGHSIIMVLHGGAMPEFMTRFPGWSARVLRRAHAIVAPSPFLAKAVGLRGFPCRVIPNVIDLRLYPFRHRRTLAPRLLWMRSFHDVYNPAMAIRVLERLRATHSGATLVMGGQDKGTEIETRRLARRLGLEDATRFPGFLDMEGKLREGESADIFINTSHVDNMPVAVVEAAAFGIPVVSTSVGGVMDLLTDRETALLVPDGDVDAMTGAIRLLLADQELAGRLSAGGRTLAERSGWDRVRPQWDEVFVKVLAAGGDTPGQASNVRP